MRAFFYTVSFILIFMGIASGIAALINGYYSAGVLFFGAAGSAGLGIVWAQKERKEND